MSNLKSIIVGLLALSLLSGCGGDELDVTMNIRLTYDGEPLVMTQDYTYPDGKLIQFNRFSFFISDLTLGDGKKSIEVIDVDYLNPTRSHLTTADALNGLTYDLGKQPISKISEVSFGIGVDPDQNATVPADYPSGDPLARPGEYWLAWDSYIFFKIEGFVDADGDGAPETSVALHVGSDEAMREVRISTNDADGNFTIVIDVKDIFGSQDLYDIVSNAQIHSLSQLPLANFLADNLSRTITIE